MQMLEVVSSNIDAIGYENNMLVVRFIGGGIYMYSGVSAELFESFKAAESKGQFFRENIKNNFTCSKLN